MSTVKTAALEEFLSRLPDSARRIEELDREIIELRRDALSAHLQLTSAALTGDDAQFLEQQATIKDLHERIGRRSVAAQTARTDHQALAYEIRRLASRHMRDRAEAVHSC